MTDSVLRLLSADFIRQTNWQTIWVLALHSLSTKLNPKYLKLMGLFLKWSTNWAFFFWRTRKTASYAGHVWLIKPCHLSVGIHPTSFCTCASEAAWRCKCATEGDRTGRNVNSTHHSVPWDSTDSECDVLSPFQPFFPFVTWLWLELVTCVLSLSIRSARRRMTFMHFLRSLAAVAVKVLILFWRAAFRCRSNRSSPSRSLTCFSSLAKVSCEMSGSSTTDGLSSCFESLCFNCERTKVTNSKLATPKTSGMNWVQISTANWHLGSFDRLEEQEEHKCQAACAARYTAIVLSRHFLLSSHESCNSKRSQALLRYWFGHSSRSFGNGQLISLSNSMFCSRFLVLPRPASPVSFRK